jgi:hypothetical protein
MSPRRFRREVAGLLVTVLATGALIWAGDLYGQHHYPAEPVSTVVTEEP